VHGRVARRTVLAGTGLPSTGLPSTGLPGTGLPGTGERLTPGSREFELLSARYRPELLAHCYRMLGSVHDAEDQVQETMLRAWRSYGEFRGQASVRTWLYRIATNACLRALENRRRRPLPSGLGTPGQDPDGPLAAATAEVPWLEPFPDALLGPAPADPAVIIGARASLRLALIAALQYLPARQRAVLILRDVLAWRAAEVAELLGTTTVAVNSALQRARAHLARVAPGPDQIGGRAPAGQAELVERFAAAFERADVEALTGLLRADAVFEMPPIPTWFRGREEIGRFLASRVLVRPGDFRMVRTGANGQPALAGYLRADDGGWHAHSVQVLSLAGRQIGHVVSFLDPGLFGVFGLPLVSPAAPG
jgi:RNA polymerase sigma-70 factor (ECF subfamily)